jgi:hypothetical protein
MRRSSITAIVRGRLRQPLHPAGGKIDIAGLFRYRGRPG